MSLAQVLKVRARSLEQARAALNAAKARARAAKEQLSAAQNRLKELKNLRPKTPNEFMLAAQTAALLRDGVAAAKERCELCQKEIMHYEHLHKRANFEHEKIAALHEEELAWAKKERERKEALELDEIATMLSARAEKI